MVEAHHPPILASRSRAESSSWLDLMESATRPGLRVETPGTVVSGGGPPGFGGCVSVPCRCN